MFPKKDRFRRFFVLLTGTALMLASCTPKEARRPSQRAEEQRIRVRTSGDTATYVVEFDDARLKEKFQRSLENYLSSYPFDTLIYDTIREYVTLRLLRKPPTEEPGQLELEPLPEHEFREEEIPPDSIFALPTDTVRDTGVVGGTARLYTSRGFVDSKLLALVSPLPFAHPGRVEELTPMPTDTAAPKSILKVDMPNPSRVRIELSEGLTNGVGQAVTAFDIVQAWHDYAKAHPGEAAAMFKEVRGVREFVRGTEAIIPGVNVANERTIILALRQPDPFALYRLSTPRLLPPQLKLGAYYAAKQDGNRLLLKANTNHYLGRGFLDELTVVMTGDNNPIVSFSLGRYEGLVLSDTEDLTYARRTLGEGANFLDYSVDRFFLVVNIPDQSIRWRIRAAVDRAEMLGSAARASGKLIGAVGVEVPASMAELSGQVPGGASPVSKKIRILFRSDDAVSSSIAEKLLSDLGRAGFTVGTVGADSRTYEQKVLSRDYEIAVGWVPQSILDSETERLRFEMLWFAGDRGETARVGDGREIPLFTVESRLVAKDRLGFVAGELSGIYLRPEETDEDGTVE